MLQKFLNKNFFSQSTALIVYIALAKLAINMLFHGRYGYFRDELYYLACSDHLAWGYVDQPPLCALILAISRPLLGDSLYAIRFSAALAGSVVVILVGLMVRKLGGSRFSQVLGALAAALSPVVLGNGARSYSMNAFDLLFWCLAAYVVLVIIKDQRPQLWPWFGVIVGLGLLNKYSMGFFVIGLVAGLLLTSERRQLGDRRFWLGAIIAFVLFLPHIWWQIQHDFPSLEFMRRAAGEKNVHLAVTDFLFGQFLQTGFAQSLLWLLGLIFCFFSREGKKFRLFGWSYLVVFALMAGSHAKVYYLTPIYFIYLAGGAYWLGTVPYQGFWKGLRPGMVLLVIALSLPVLPFAIPALAIDDFISYSQKLGLTPKAEERNRLAELPQYYADMFGWEEMVAQVAGIYGRLTPEEKSNCVIYVRNYGQAGAIDFFGRQYGLPKALCAHNNYWYWKPARVHFKLAIIIGSRLDLEANLADLQGPGRFQQVELAATTSCNYCMPFENNRQIFLCRGPQFSFEDIWLQEKDFI